MRGIHVSIACFFILYIGESKSRIRHLEYGKDFIFFPSEDGSNQIVPAVLTNVTQFGGTKVTPAVADVHFYLYTSNNTEQPEELFANDIESLQRSHFVKDQDLKILCHGFANSYINGFPKHTKNRYLSVYGSVRVNVISLDWSLLALAPFYVEAVDHVALVGHELGKLIESLVEFNVTSVDKIHIIGHSLGAHVAGIAGRYVNQQLEKKVARVTGLDPAAPLVEGTEVSIDSKVATFVDIIHTDGEFLGIPSRLGMVDFYPNGGLDQNCTVDLFGSCSHTLSHEYYLESIVPRNISSSKFKSCSCTDCRIRQDPFCYQDLFLAGKCNCNRGALMGESSSTALRGAYFLNTNTQTPYSQS